MTKHTPGPWNYERDYTWRPMTREWTLRIYAEDPGPSNDFHIAYVTDPDRETREAHANLIAAAPELLEALKAVVKTIAPDGNISKCEGFFREPLLKASAAIVKAEGRA